MADPTAVMGPRIGAFLIDAIAISAIIFAVVIPSFLSLAETREWATTSAAEAHCQEVNRSTFAEDRTGEVTFGSGENFCAAGGTTTYELTPDDFNTFSLRFYGITFLAVVADWLVLQGLTGASLGKLLIGLRVVRPDGSKAGFGWIVLRGILLPVDLFCCGVVGLLTAFNAQNHRRVGDMAASTAVVRTGSVGTPLPQPGAYGPPTYGAPAYGPPAAGGWGTPPSPWGAPPTSTPNADGPVWDEARNAYIQYDRNRGEWVQWDDGAQAWGPIDQ